MYSLPPGGRIPWAVASGLRALRIDERRGWNPDSVIARSVSDAAISIDRHALLAMTPLVSKTAIFSLRHLLEQDRFLRKHVRTCMVPDEVNTRRCLLAAFVCSIPLGSVPARLLDLINQRTDMPSGEVINRYGHVLLSGQ